MFGSSAFSETAFCDQPEPGVAPIIIDDTHDGEYRPKKLWDKERKAREKRKRQIIDAYERLVEGKITAVAAVVAPFVEPAAKVTGATAQEPKINFDALLADLERMEMLWALYLAMDDEDVLALL